MDRVAAIRSRLEAAFTPDLLEIIDDSHLHAGHAGAREHGGGHFRVRIRSAAFDGMKVGLLPAWQNLYLPGGQSDDHRDLPGRTCEPSVGRGPEYLLPGRNPRRRRVR